MSPKIIQSVSDAIDSIHYFESNRGNHIFRGHIDNDWKLLPSLYRRYPKSKFPPRQASLFEVSLCGPLMIGMKAPYLHTFDPIELLMVLQHFDIPTRLLDWTSDILVALFLPVMMIPIFAPIKMVEYLSWNVRLILSTTLIVKKPKF